MMSLSPDSFGCASTQGYSKRRDVSFRRLPALNGRPRYRPINMSPSYFFDVTYEFSQSQFTQFKSFWAAGPAQAKPFMMWLKLTTNELYVIQELVVARATGPYSAVQSPYHDWTVSFTVELPGDTAVTGTICDVIWAGPVSNPASDIIWNGPIDDLPADIIAPCEGVFYGVTTQR